MREVEATHATTSPAEDLRIGADAAVLARCVDALAAVSRAPEFVEVRLHRSAYQEHGYAWLGFVVWHPAGWWERNGLAVEAPDLGAGRRMTVELDALVEAVATCRRRVPQVELEWRAEGLLVADRVVRAVTAEIPPFPEIRKSRDAVYLAPGSAGPIVVESELGRVGISAEVVEHLRERNAAVVEFGTVDGDVYLLAHAEQRAERFTVPVVVARAELLMWSDASRRTGISERRRRGGNEVEDLLAALDPDTSPERLLELLDSAVGYVRRRVVAHPRLPVEVVESLAETGTSAMRAAAAGNPGLSQRVVERLARDDNPLVRAALGANPTLDPLVLERLAADEAAEVREAAAANPGLAPKRRVELAGDPSPAVRAVVAAATSEPEVLARLARDPVPAVCAAVARNPSCPAAILTDLLEVVPAAVLGNPSAPETVLLAGARALDGELRAVVGANPSTPTQVLSRLARDPDLRVLRALMSNPRTPASARRKVQKRVPELDDAGPSTETERVHVTVSRFGEKVGAT